MLLKQNKNFSKTKNKINTIYNIKKIKSNLKINKKNVRNTTRNLCMVSINRYIR